MEPKNLLFIMSDEHNARFMGAAGHEVVHTPNLDSLAARGTMFDNAYTNCPICVPARASFATGRHVHDCGYWDNADPYDGRVKGWGHRLIEQGHRSVSVGKLHYRNATDPTGFDEEIVPLNVVEGVGDLIGLLRDPLPQRKGTAKFSRDTGAGESTYTNYDRTIVAEASRWLTEEGPRQEKPWVLFVSFVCPHFPLIAPEEFYRLYPEDSVPWPELYDAAQRPEHPFHRAMAACMNYDDHFDEAAVRRAVAGYLGLTTFLDDNIGKVMQALSASGQAGDTRVIYTSDHGESLGKRGFWGKSTMFEESVAVPLIMAGPGIAEGKRVATPVSLVDCAPTILESVGATPAPEDASWPGRSLYAIADAAEPDRVVLSEYHAAGAPTGAFMVRQGRYKLCHYVGMASELYDLESDPEETTDLAGDPAHAGTVHALTELLHAICDPAEVNARALAEQRAKVEVHGGREAVLARGDFGYSPAPGQTPQFAA